MLSQSVEVCADTEPGDQLVRCVCGKSRPRHRAHGWVNDRKRWKELVKSVAQKHYDILKEEVYKVWCLENGRQKGMPVWMLPKPVDLEYIEYAFKMGWIDEEGRAIPASPSSDLLEFERLQFNTFRE